MFEGWCVSIEIICRFSVILIKILGQNFIDIDKLSLKLIWKGKENKVVKKFMKCNNEATGLSLLGFNICHKATVVKTM